MPGDVEDRVVVALGEARVAPGVARVAPLEGVAAGGAGRVIRRVIAVAAGTVCLGLGDMTGRLDEAAELPDRDLVLAQVEGPGDADPVDRASSVSLRKRSRSYWG